MREATLRMYPDGVAKATASVRIINESVLGAALAVAWKSAGPRRRCRLRPHVSATTGKVCRWVAAATPACRPHLLLCHLRRPRPRIAQR